MINVALYSALAVLCAIVTGFLPRSVLDPLTAVLSLGKNGIRNIRRKRNTTDTLANVCLFISLLFSCFYWLLPVHWIIYAILLILSYLCALAQANRVTKKMDTIHRSLVIVCVSLMFFFGLFTAIGCMNHFETFDSASKFCQDLWSGNAFHLFYYLRDFAPMMVLLQGILYMIPMYCMWAQFKYMRLENTYKSRNIGLFLLKVLFLCALMVFFAYGGIEILNWAYYIDHVEV